jgi:multisubunit Na+/H+ antiporter MnhB subunit
MRLTGQGMKRLIGLMNIAVGVVLCTIFGPVLVERSWLPGRAFDVWLGLAVGVGGLIAGCHVLWRAR